MHLAKTRPQFMRSDFRARYPVQLFGGTRSFFKYETHFDESKIISGTIIIIRKFHINWKFSVVIGQWIGHNSDLLHAGP